MNRPRLRTSHILACLLVAAPTASSAKSTVVGADRAAIAGAARQLASGESLRAEALPWAGAGGGGSARPFAFDLERFEVWAAGSRIVVHRIAGDEVLERPANIYLRGRVVGDAATQVVLSVLVSGEVRGLAVSRDRTWVLAAKPADAALSVREVAPRSELEEAGGGFRCELDGLGSVAYRAEDDSVEKILASAFAQTSTAAAPAGRPAGGTGEGGAFDHTAVIAIESDNEFLALFSDNTTDAANYIADLVAFSSTIYTDEVQTSWIVGDVSLWATADPWEQTSPSCGLIDFGRYWNNNHAAISRTVTHFLSGKSTNAGIAWVGVLCSGAFNIDAAQVATGCSPPLSGTSNWGGAYGYTSGIDGNFDINSPSVVWDIMAFTHEIGHNFNSPHTHCYQNVGGNGSAIDQCYGSQAGTGCYAGSTSLPSGCPGSGQGCGTIMSYCHLLGGGLGNTSLTLGLGHPYGVAPERVPNRMRSHVVSVATGNPSCLAPVGILFIDGFNSGNTSAWSAVAP